MQNYGGLFMLTIAKFDRCDVVNNPLSDRPSFTIWFSGCTFKCEDCYNEALWNKEYGEEYSAKIVSMYIESSCNKLNVDDVVFLGGEPLQQDRGELLYLCKLLSKARKKIWIYTGYDFDVVKNEYSDILEYAYTVKCGRYDKNLKQYGFPASSNQKVYRKINNSWREIKMIGG